MQSYALANTQQVDIRHYANNSDLVNELAQQVVEQLQVAIESRGKASLAVSGGSTPIPLFAQLSSAAIDWSKVLITLVDERWVEPNHADSNAALVRKHLLQDKASAAEFVSLKVAASTPFVGEQAVANRLRLFDGPFDVLILGMGSDGHTASLFSNSEPLQYALEPRHGEPCCGIVRADLEHPRITLTLPRILNSRQMYLHTVGKDKFDVLQRACEPGDVNELPVRAVLLQHQTPIHVYHADE